MGTCCVCIRLGFEDFVTELAQIVREEVVASKTILCKEGSASIAAYYIIKGNVLQYAFMCTVDYRLLQVIAISHCVCCAGRRALRFAYAVHRDVSRTHVWRAHRGHACVSPV